jgi:hypothetical protein
LEKFFTQGKEHFFEAVCVFEGPAFINPRWAQNALQEPQNYSLPYIWTTTPKVTRGGVSHCGLAIYIKKYLNAKRIIMETHIFHHAKI